MDSLTNSRIVVLALSCLVTSAAGGFLGGTLVQEPAIPPLPPPVPEPDPLPAIAELGARVDALGVELRQALSSLRGERAGDSTPESRRSAETPGAPVAASSSRPEATPRSVLAQPPELGVQVLWNRIAAWPEEQRSQEELRLRQEHVLWTVAEVVRAYGKPTEIRTGQGILILEYKSVDDPRGSLQVTFTCAGGLVSTVYTGRG